MKICSISVLAVLLLSGIGFPSASADTKYQTISGCLRQGVAVGHYTITTQDGVTWLLRSTKIDIANHVGETVEITGEIPQTEPLPKDEQAHPRTTAREVVDRNISHHLVVTKLLVVSKACEDHK